MKRKNLITAATAATASLMLTLGVFWPVDLQAKDPKPGSTRTRKPLIPALTVDGCRIELHSRPGSSVLVLKLINPTARAMTLSVDVSLTSQAPVSPLSRRMVIPKVVWNKRLPLELAPGETRILRLPTKVMPAKGQQLTFQLRIGKKMISSRSLLFALTFMNGAPKLNITNVMRRK